MHRRQSIPENRVDLEIEIQDSKRQLDKQTFYWHYTCVCGTIFTHAIVPRCCVQDLRCPACKKDLTTKAEELTK